MKVKYKKLDIIEKIRKELKKLEDKGLEPEVIYINQIETHQLYDLYDNFHSFKSIDRQKFFNQVKNREMTLFGYPIRYREDA